MWETDDCLLTQIAAWVTHSCCSKSVKTQNSHPEIWDGVKVSNRGEQSHQVSLGGRTADWPPKGHQLQFPIVQDTAHQPTHSCPCAAWLDSGGWLTLPTAQEMKLVDQQASWFICNERYSVWVKWHWRSPLPRPVHPGWALWNTSLWELCLVSPESEQEELAVQFTYSVATSVWLLSDSLNSFVAFQCLR